MSHVTVRQSNGYTIALDDDKNKVVSIGSDAVVIQAALDYLSNGGILLLKFPENSSYAIGSSILTANEGTSIIGEGYDNRELNTPTNTRLWFSNGGHLILNSYCKLDNIVLTGDSKTDTSPTLLIQGSFCTIGSVYAFGNAYGPTVQFGNGTDLISGCVTNNLYIGFGNNALYLNCCTQSHFAYVLITGFTNNGCSFEKCDNNTFSHLLITSPLGTSGNLTNFGISNYCYGNNFSYLDLSTPTGFNSIVVNYKLIVGQNINYIQNLTPEGQLTVVHNNNATQSVYGFNSLTLQTGYI